MQAGNLEYGLYLVGEGCDLHVAVSLADAAQEGDGARRAPIESTNVRSEQSITKRVEPEPTRSYAIFLNVAPYPRPGCLRNALSVCRPVL
jgi:hypothetical protein